MLAFAEFQTLGTGVIGPAVVGDDPVDLERRPPAVGFLDPVD
jgi:hypothetical protein